MTLPDGFSIRREYKHNYKTMTDIFYSLTDRFGVNPITALCREETIATGRTVPFLENDFDAIRRMGLVQFDHTKMRKVAILPDK